MGFLSNWFGSGASDNIYKTAGTNRGLLTQGDAEAKNQLNLGATNSLGALNSGFGTARNDVNSGFSSAAANYGSGIDAAKNAATSYGDQANARLDPLINGYKANTVFNNANGVNGAQAQNDYNTQFLAANSPLTSARDAYANQQLNAYGNAHGQSAAGSGRTALALSRAAQQRLQEDVNNNTANVNIAANREAGAAGQASSNTMNTGNTVSGLEAQRGQGLAALNTQQAGALGNLDTGLAGAQAGVYGGLGTNLANEATNYATAQANLNTGAANAANQANQNGFNNLLGVGSLAVSAFNPFGGGARAPTSNQFDPNTGRLAAPSYSSPFQNFTSTLSNGFNSLNPWGTR